MKKVFLGVLFSGLVLSSLSFAQTPTPAAAQATTPAPVVVEKPRKEHREHGGEHGGLRKIIRKLKSAKEELQKGHGNEAHRTAAIGHIDEAIAELKAGVEADKK